MHWERARALHAWLVARGPSVLIFAALFCNLAVKLYHALTCHALRYYPTWILADIAILLGLETALSLICHRWQRPWVLRTATIFAAAILTWSVTNAGWVIRTGTQILPMELLPLIRDPWNISKLVGKNLVHMPWASAALFIPSGIAVALFASVLKHPGLVSRTKSYLIRKAIATVLIIAFCIAGLMTVTTLGSVPVATVGMRFNCQSQALLAFLLPRYRNISREDFLNAKRQLPTIDQTEVALTHHRTDYNVVIVVLEGVQYGCTSLASPPQEGAGCVDDLRADPTPYLGGLAAQGASFANARSAVAHTTKALFALLSGRLPSASQDIAETIPARRHYASLATILEKGLGYRTAFFQSALGTFESRPGLIYNLGFNKFFAREDLSDPTSFVGYLGADEFELLGPMTEWITGDDSPFLLVSLCSVTHDPYEVPQWFGEAATEQTDRYYQTIRYVDHYINALDARLADLGLAENTIFCVIGDHGEAFAEHGQMGHERIVYEEVLRIPFCLRAPLLIEPGRRITAPVSSVDLTPTILALLGVNIDDLSFDGTNVLAPLPPDRKVYFSGWMQQGPAGFVQQDRKYIYYPEHDTVWLYRLSTDPLELSPFEMPPGIADRFREDIVTWRRNTVFRVDQEESGETVLFNSWHFEWNRSRRTSGVRHRPAD
jgi:hypothetical protein